MKYIKKLKEMFQEMVVKKNPDLIPNYYQQDFLLYTNEKVMNYDEFLKSHQDYYATPLKYEVEYDEETFIEQGEKIAGRMWITTSHLNESRKIEVILIVQYKDNKIYRLWELTYPDWTKLEAFKS